MAKSKNTLNLRAPADARTLGKVLPAIIHVVENMSKEIIDKIGKIKTKEIDRLSLVNGKSVTKD